MTKDKINRTMRELEQHGLKRWVADFILLRKEGNIWKAKSLKKAIDEAIRVKKLDRNTVYFCFGNPDDPSEREEAYRRATNLEL